HRARTQRLRFSRRGDGAQAFLGSHRALQPARDRRPQVVEELPPVPDTGCARDRQAAPQARSAAGGGPLMRARLRTLAASVGYGPGLAEAGSRAGDQWRLVRGQDGVSIRRHPSDSFLILIYHRVAEPRPFTLEAVAPRDFERQMRYLARHFQILPLGDI